MVGESTIGPDARLERVLDGYGLGVEGWAADLVESDLQRLLLAQLLEQRGETLLDAMDAQEDDQSEASYWTTEDPVTVDSTDEDDTHLEWEFPASSVSVWGFDAPIYVAFRSEGGNRRINLHPDDDGLSLDPAGGLDASGVWIRKQNPADSDTQVKVVAMK